jgi:hypothetical protein
MMLMMNFSFPYFFNYSSAQTAAKDLSVPVNLQSSAAEHVGIINVESLFVKYRAGKIFADPKGRRRP